jgi:hypothetical protein
MVAVIRAGSQLIFQSTERRWSLYRMLTVYAILIRRKDFTTFRNWTFASLLPIFGTTVIRAWHFICCSLALP